MTVHENDNTSVTLLQDGQHHIPLPWEVYLTLKSTGKSRLTWFHRTKRWGTKRVLQTLAPNMKVQTTYYNTKQTEKLRKDLHLKRKVLKELRRAVFKEKTSNYYHRINTIKKHTPPPPPPPLQITNRMVIFGRIGLTSKPLFP